METQADFPRTVLILAGGYGSRMGGEKLALAVDSEPVLLRVIRRVTSFADEILLSIAPRQISYVSTVLSGIISSYGIRIVQDYAASGGVGRQEPVSGMPFREERGGPLAGIVSGLEASSSDWLFVCACDMPRISESVVRVLWKNGDKNASVIVPVLGGFYEPLHAFYRKDCLTAAKYVLETGRKKTTAFYGDVMVSAVNEQFFSHLPGYRRSFENLNSKSDLEKLSGLLG